MRFSVITLFCVSPLFLPGPLSLLSPTHSLISVCLICMMLVVVVYRGWVGFCGVVTFVSRFRVLSWQRRITAVNNCDTPTQINRCRRRANFCFIPCFTCRFFQHRDRYFGTRVSVFDLNLTTHTEILVRA